MRTCLGWLWCAQKALWILLPGGSVSLSARIPDPIFCEIRRLSPFFANWPPSAAFATHPGTSGTKLPCPSRQASSTFDVLDPLSSSGTSWGMARSTSQPCRVQPLLLVPLNLRCSILGLQPSQPHLLKLNLKRRRNACQTTLKRASWLHGCLWTPKMFLGKCIWNRNLFPAMDRPHVHSYEVQVGSFWWPRRFKFVCSTSTLRCRNVRQYIKVRMVIVSLLVPFNAKMAACKTAHQNFVPLQRKTQQDSVKTCKNM